MEGGAPLPPCSASGENLSAQAGLPLSDGCEEQPRSLEQEQMKQHRLGFWQLLSCCLLRVPRVYVHTPPHTHTHLWHLTSLKKRATPTTDLWWFFFITLGQLAPILPDPALAVQSSDRAVWLRLGSLLACLVID